VESSPTDRNRGALAILEDLEQPAGKQSVRAPIHGLADGALLIHPVTVSEPSKIVIIGAGEFAQIAYEYLTHDSPYEVVGFSIGRDFLDRPELCGLPVVPFDELESHFDPAQNSAIVAVTYAHLNRVRTRL